MKKEKTTEISVKAVFAGSKDYEQLFLELVRKNFSENFKKSAVFSPKICYNENVISPMYTPFE